MKNSTFSKPWSYLRDLVSTDAVKSHRRSTLWLMLFTLLLLPTSMVAQTNQAYAEFDNSTETLTFKWSNSTSIPAGAYALNEGISMPGWIDKKNTKKVVFDASFANARPTSCHYWFCKFTNLTTIEGIEYLNTENVTNMNSMFDRCSALTSLDLTNFNTAKVTDMRYMFMGCNALTTIFVSDKFVTSQVTKSVDMFHMCINLIGAIEYDGSKSDHNYANYETGYFTPKGGFHAYAEFDEGTGTLTFRRGASKPEGAYDLYGGIYYPGWWYGQKGKIKTVVFDASFANARPTSCYCWFSGCNNLTEIKGIEYLNTENVTNMSYMFSSCKALTSLNLSNFNTEKVTDMQGMFKECSNLTSLNLSNFNTENVTDMNGMFYGCTKLESLDLSNFNTAKVAKMNYMFFHCYALTSLDLSNFNTAEVTNMSYMFKSCNALTSLDLTSFNTAKVENMTEMFNNCPALTTIYASDKFVTTKVSSGSEMFKDCKNLKGFIDYINNTDKTNHRYANYVDGYFTKLVVRNGDERFGITGETTQLTVDNLVLADGKDFVAYEPFTATAASYSRTIKEGTTWATLCLPFEVSLDGQNFRAFKLLSANDATNTIELEEITTSIAAGTPVIIKMTNGATELNFSVNNKDIAKDAQTTATADNNYQLQGLYAKKVFVKDTDDNCYIVKGNKLMNPSKLLENTKVQEVNCKAFRAYMVDNSSTPAGAKMFSIGFDETATSIDNLNTNADDKAIYYDLQGHRLNGPQRGVNIVKRGNKTMKVIIK